MKLAQIAQGISNLINPTSTAAGGWCDAGFSDDTLPARATDTAASQIGCVSASAEENGVSALHLAASAGDVSAVAGLLAHSHPDVADRWGQTSLHYAATAPLGEGVIKLLIEAGANPHQVAGSGRSPLQQAVGAGSAANVRSFLRGLVARAVSRGQLPQIESAPAPTIEVAQTRNFESLCRLIRLAITAGNGDTLAALVKFAKPPKRVRWADQIGQREQPAPALVSPAQAQTLARRAVTWAAQSGNSTLLRQLKGHGVDLNAPNERRFSPLLRMAWHGDVKGVTALLDAGVDINTRGPRGYTALHLAAAAGQGDVVRLLKKHGADRSARNDRGHTPLETAVALDRVESIVALRKPENLAERLGISKTQRAVLVEPISAAATAALGQVPDWSDIPGEIDTAVLAEVRQAS